MNPETVLSIIALVVALVAAVIAFGQVLQQYASSGELIRLCDKIVYGGAGNGIPGYGRRRWQWTQFRFRVIYEIPRLSLHYPVGFLNHLVYPPYTLDDYLPTSSAMARMQNPTSEGLTFAQLDTVTGEAAWMTFFRFMQYKKVTNIGLRFISGDADRCPPDLPTVPSPISMRTVALMGLAAGMECTDASFHSKSISMQSRDGAITTSQHPVLGPLIHFTSSYDVIACPPQIFAVHKQWIERAHGYIPLRYHIVQNVAWLIQEEEIDMALQGWLQPASPSTKTLSVGSFERLWYQDPEMPMEHFHNPRGFVSRLHAVKLLHEHLKERLWYWCCQIAIFSGPWATPWKDIPDPAFIVDCVMLIRKEIRSLSQEDGIEIVQSLVQNVEHLPLQQDVFYCSTPPYSRDRPPGLQGRKDPSPLPIRSWRNSPIFESRLPIVRVFGLYVQSMEFGISDATNQELMNIDARLEAAAESWYIRHGSSSLLKRTPYLVQRWLQGCHTLFQNRQSILSDRYLLATLTTELLGGDDDFNPAEFIFFLMALLRTLKAAWCIVKGFDTTKLIDILEYDIQAHLV